MATSSQYNEIKSNLQQQGSLTKHQIDETQRSTQYNEIKKRLQQQGGFSSQESNGNQRSDQYNEIKKQLQQQGGISKQQYNRNEYVNKLFTDALDSNGGAAVYYARAVDQMKAAGVNSVMTSGLLKEKDWKTLQDQAIENYNSKSGALNLAAVAYDNYTEYLRAYVSMATNIKNANNVQGIDLPEGYESTGNAAFDIFTAEYLRRVQNEDPAAMKFKKTATADHTKEQADRAEAYVREVSHWNDRANDINLMGTAGHRIPQQERSMLEWIGNTYGNTSDALAAAKLSATQTRRLADNLVATNRAVYADDFAEKSVFDSAVTDETYRKTNTRGEDNFLEDQEVAVYNYIYATEGAAKAQAYLDTLVDELNKRKGQSKADSVDGNFLGQMWVKAQSGFDQFGSGIASLFNDGQPKDPSVIQYASTAVDEDLADVDLLWYNIADKQWKEQDIFGRSLGQMAGDTVQTTANMLPSIGASAVISAINPTAGAWAGAILMGSSAAGNAYQDMLNQGYSKGSAATYGTLVGISEALLEKVLGGISPISGGGGLQKLTSKFAKVDGVLKKFADSAGGKILLNAGSEAMEEGLQSVLEPFFKTIVTGEEFTVDMEEALYSALLGFVTGGMFESGNQAVNAAVGKISDSIHAKENASTEANVPNMPSDQLSSATATDLSSGIRDQIRNRQNDLNAMPTVAEIQVSAEYMQMDVADKKNWVAEKLRPTGYQVERKGFGIIEFAKKRLKSAFNYFDKGSPEEVAFEAIPYVLEHGIEISSRENHKDREYGTVTIAAPVTINGKRGNMAVVVKKTTGNHYKVHRILTPDGSVFVLPDTASETGSTPAGEAPVTGSLATPKDPASTDIVEDEAEIVKTYARESKNSTRMAEKNSPTFQEEVQRQFEQANMRQNQNTEGGVQYGDIDEGNTGPAVAQGGGGNLAAGDGLLLGGIQRNDGAGPAEQTGVLAGSAEQSRSAYADRSRATVARQNYARSLRLEKVSSLDLGLQNGTEARNIQVMPQENWDTEMSQLADRIYNETGKKVTYIMGRIQIRGTGGTVGYARGVITSDRIIVQADNLRLPMEKIADHEAYHAKADFSGGRLNDEIRRHIVETFSEEQFRQVLDKYIVGLRGVIDVNETQTGAEFEDAIRQIEEEIFADAYAGINAFDANADQFTGAVNEKMDQLYMGKIREQENGTERPTGPPTERFSIDTINGEKADYGVGVVLDTNIFQGVRPREWGEVLGKYVYDNLAGAELIVYDSQGNQERIYIAKTNDRARKDGAKNSHKVIDKIARYRGDNIKALATVHLSELLITSRYENATSEQNHQWLDENGWEYRKTYIQDRNGNIYEATLNIANGKDRRILYDINNIRQIDKKRVARGVVPSTNDGRGSLTKSNSPMERIAEPDGIVKERFSYEGDSTEEYSNRDAAYMDAVNRGDTAAAQKMVDDMTSEDYDALDNEFQAMQRGEKERFLRERLGDEGYGNYKVDRDNKARKRKEDAAVASKVARDVKASQRKLRLEAETTKVNHEEQQRMREDTAPAKAKKMLRNTVLNIFSIPNGQKAELGSLIDSYADRLIKNGRLTEEDHKAFFDRMYASGVMTVPADDYYAEARSYLKKGRIYVPDGVVADFSDDWNDIRRRAFAAGIYLTRSRVSSGYSVAGIDVWNSDLAGELPGLFDAEETDQRSILERIVQVAEEGRDENMSLSEYTARLAETEHQSEDEFLDNMERQLDWALRTFAASANIEIETKTQEIRKQAATRRQNLKLQATLATERQERKDSARRAQERRELQELQQRTLKQLQWLSKNRFRAPEELQATWDEVLSDIDIYAISAADEMRWSDKHNATWKDLAQMYKDAMKNDPNFMPSKELERIVARLDGTKIADMDVGALQDLYKAAIGLRTEFYNRNNVINDEMQRLFAEVYTDAKREIESAPHGFTGGVADKFLNLDQLTPMNVLQRMGGWDPDGAFYSMAKQLERGERDMRAYSVKAQKMLQEFLTEHQDWVKKADGQGKDAIWYEVEVPQLLELRMGDKPIFGPTVKVYMTPAQKVHMYLESKNLDNLRHMVGGRTFVNKELYSKGKRQEALSQGRTIKLAPETVRMLVSDLTQEEMELATLLDRYYNTFATQEINRVSNVLYGYDKAMGKNYAPIYTNRNYTKTEFGVFDTTAEGVGNLKGREYAVNPSYNISAFDAFERHVDQTARFCGMAIPARNWTTLMNWREKNNSTGDVITHKWGEESKRYITDLITTLQAGDDAKSDTISSGFSKLQSNYISAIFGANPSIVLKQLGSIPLAGAYLDAKNVPTLAQISQIDRDLISKYSQDLEWRTMGYTTPETKQLKDNPNWTQSNKAFKFVFGGGAITAMDGWAASVLWPWAENKVRREHPELALGGKAEIENGDSAFYKKVAEEFENAMSRSQSVSDEIHQSRLRKSKNPITRSFTMFRSDSAQTYNVLRQKIGEAQYYKRSGADEKVVKSSKIAVGSAFMALLLNAAWAEGVSFLMALWKNKGKNYRDDEDELTFWSVAGEMVFNMLGSFTGVVTGGEELLELIGNIITGEKWYGIETPGMEQFNNIMDIVYESGSNMRNLVAGGWDVLKNGGNLVDYFGKHNGQILGGIKDLAEAAAMYLPGLPASNLEAYLVGAMKWISPELGAAYDDLFSDTGKSDLAGMEGGALEGRIGRILSDRNVSESDATAKALADLYAAGYEAAVPSDTPTSVTIKDERYALSVYQQQVYDTIWSSIVADGLDDMVASDSFAEADPETQAKMLSNLYNYAAARAKDELFDEYEPDSSVEKNAAIIAAGASVAECFTLSGSLSNLQPSEGSDRVTDIQRWRECVDFSTNEAIQLAALAGVMTDKQYAKVNVAYEYDVSPAEYVTLRETLVKYDANGNGSLSNSEVTDAINSLRGLSKKQKAVLWQLSVSSKSAKNNPYSPEVGEQVLKALSEE